MTNIQISSLFLNFILYLLMTFPLIIISSKKKNFLTKKNFLYSLFISLILEIFLSIIIYIFSRNIFSIFTKKTGIINHAIYVSRILFITSGFYGVKFLIPAYLIYNQKKSAIFIFEKTAVTIILSIFLYLIFNLKGFLYAFPISDIIFYIIYLNIIRKNI